MTAATDELICGRCGYNLTGVPSNRCPECGARFDPRYLINDNIPWEQRRHRGWIRCFFRTIWLSSFQVEALAKFADRPVSYAHAYRFRRAVVAITGIALAAWLCWIRQAADVQSPFLKGQYSDDQYSLYHRAWILILNPFSFALWLAGLVLWLWMSSGAAAWFFHPSRLAIARQNRAVALSQYSCAPLAWLPLALLPSLIVLLPGEQSGLAAVRGQRLMIAGAALIVIELVGWMLMRRASIATARWLLMLAGMITVPLFIVGVGVCWSTRFGPTTADTPVVIALTCVCCGAAAVTIVWSWINSIRLLRLSTAAGRARTITMSVALPVVWIGLWFLIQGAIHGVFVFVQVLMESRRRSP